MMSTEIFKLYKNSCTLFDAQNTGNHICELLDFTFFWRHSARPPPRSKGPYGPFSGHSCLLCLQWPLIQCNWMLLKTLQTHFPFSYLLTNIILNSLLTKLLILLAVDPYQCQLCASWTSPRLSSLLRRYLWAHHTVFLPCEYLQKRRPGTFLALCLSITAADFGPREVQQTPAWPFRQFKCVRGKKLKSI